MNKNFLVLRDCGGLRGLIENEIKAHRYHRIEVEHALHLANFNIEETQGILEDAFRENRSQLNDISYRLDNLTDTISGGISVISDRIYQLHLDNIGTQSVLDDILLCLVDKESYKRELESRRRRAKEQYRILKASGQYRDAMTLTQRALRENNQGKACAMLDEAIILFERASQNHEYGLDAHFQLGYLLQIHKGDLDEAKKHYYLSLGEPYSAHNIRVLRHLSHLDYLQDHYDKALERMADVVNYTEIIESFANDLAKVYSLEWPNCIDALERVLKKNNSLLNRSNNLNTVQAFFSDGRRFTATENFKQNYSAIMDELQNIKPDINIFFDGARYAAKMGDGRLARLWLEKKYNTMTSLNAKRLMLIEARSCGDFGDVF